MAFPNPHTMALDDPDERFGTQSPRANSDALWWMVNEASIGRSVVRWLPRSVERRTQAKTFINELSHLFLKPY